MNKYSNGAGDNLLRKIKDFNPTKRTEKMKTITASNIQEELEKANCVIFNHCSDLYTPVNDASTKIINSYEFKESVTTFKCQVTGTMHYDLGGCYSSKK